MVAVAGHRLGNRWLWPFSAGAQVPFSSSASSVSVQLTSIIYVFYRSTISLFLCVSSLFLL